MATTRMTMWLPADHHVEEVVAKATEDDKSRQVDAFDAGKPPPFRIGDVRAAVPEHCWRKSPWRSLWYVARDVAVVVALGAAAAAADSWAVWPLYWAAQGTMFWALFTLGHDWYVRRPLLLKAGTSRSSCVSFFCWLYDDDDDR